MDVRWGNDRRDFLLPPFETSLVTKKSRVTILTHKRNVKSSRENLCNNHDDGGNLKLLLSPTSSFHNKG